MAQNQTARDARTPAKRAERFAARLKAWKAALELIDARFDRRMEARTAEAIEIADATWTDQQAAN